jgi:hypothetical protein
VALHSIIQAYYPGIVPHPRSCSHSKKKRNDHLSQRRIKNAIKVVGEDEKCAMSNTRIPEKGLAE